MKRNPRERSPDGGAPGQPDHVRLDKWLWAARFFKTRALAIAAIESGKVELNGVRAKPASPTHAGDRVRVRLGPYVHAVLVRALSTRRGPAAEAAELYEETAESRDARQRLAWQLRHAVPVHDWSEGRPTKKERRALRRLRGR